MRCRKGDLAVVTASGENAGRLVEVVVAIGEVFAGQPFRVPDGSFWTAMVTGFCWWCKSTGQPLFHSHLNHEGKTLTAMERPFHDIELRPIRDGDKADEIPNAEPMKLLPGKSQQSWARPGTRSPIEAAITEAYRRSLADARAQLWRLP